MGTAGLVVASSAAAILWTAALFVHKLEPASIEHAVRVLLWLGGLLGGWLFGCWEGMDQAAQIALRPSYESPVAREIFHEIMANSLPMMLVMVVMLIPFTIIQRARQARKHAQP